MKRLTLPFRVKKPILACGADLKGAFALAKGKDAYLFDGFGDLSDLENFKRYEKAVRAAEKELKINPQVVVCDMHPGYFSTQFAENYKKNGDTHFLSIKRCMKMGIPIFQVQHHEAHIASAIADNYIKGDLLGVSFDGTGYGLDGNIWGGEFFTGNAKKFKRVAHLKYIPMPGGDMAIREPWRMAASYIYSVFGSGFLKNGGTHFLSIKRCIKMGVPIFQMIEKNMNSPLTSSTGRLFDAVGSLVLNKRYAEFEAELPIELERIVDKDEYGHYDFGLKKRNGAISIDMSKTIKGILKDLDKKAPRSKISAKFHNTIALAILKIAKIFDVKKIVLSGGVFQNNFLSKKTEELLEGEGFKVYMHSKVETNDSGIPLGQIAIANARVLCA